jgi:hypothetical protein
MSMYLWRFSAYGFQIIERLPIVISDVSWNAERFSLSQEERKSSEHLDRGNVLRRFLLSGEERLACSYTSCTCIPTIYSEDNVSCRPIFQHERHLFHVVHAPSQRCPSGYPEQHLPWPMDWSWRNQLCTRAHLTWIVLRAWCGST